MLDQKFQDWTAWN